MSLAAIVPRYSSGLVITCARHRTLILQCPLRRLVHQRYNMSNDVKQTPRTLVLCFDGTAGQYDSDVRISTDTMMGRLC